MSSTQTIKTMAATLTVGVLLAGFFAATAAAGNGVSKAERARAEATNRYYGLGTVDSKAVLARARATDKFYGLEGKSQGLQAEKRRSEAMNRFYGLGAYSKQVRQAEERRSQAIDRTYHLGRYAVIGGSRSFEWADAGIGAGATLGALLAVGGLAVVARRRLSAPSTT